MKDIYGQTLEHSTRYLLEVATFCEGYKLTRHDEEFVDADFLYRYHNQQFRYLQSNPDCVGTFKKIAISDDAFIAVKIVDTFKWDYLSDEVCRIEYP